MTTIHNPYAMPDGPITLYEVPKVGDHITITIKARGWRKWLRILQGKPVSYVETFKVEADTHG